MNQERAAIISAIPPFVVRIRALQKGQENSLRTFKNAILLLQLGHFMIVSSPVSLIKLETLLYSILLDTHLCHRGKP
jgi:hypothetical protein